MTDVTTVSLEGQIRGGATIRFLRLEQSLRGASPFALVRYAEGGREQPLGLRIDLDKRAFLDHFDDPVKEAVLRQAAPKIVDLLADKSAAAGEEIASLPRLMMPRLMTRWWTLPVSFDPGISATTLNTGEGAGCVPRLPVSFDPGIPTTTPLPRHTCRWPTRRVSEDVSGMARDPAHTQAFTAEDLQGFPPETLVALAGRCVRRVEPLLWHPDQRRFATEERLRLINQCARFAEVFTPYHFSLTREKETLLGFGKKLLDQAEQSARDCRDHESNLSASGGEETAAYYVVMCAGHAVAATLAAGQGGMEDLIKETLNTCNAAELAPTSDLLRAEIIRQLQDDFHELSDRVLG